VNILKEIFKKIPAIIFGGLVDKYYDYFNDLKKKINEADLKILTRTYVCLMFFVSTIAFFVSLPVLFFLLIVYNINPVLTPILSLSVGGLAFAMMYYYPYEKAGSRKRSIETNLPFAVNHMAAISSSGVPPKIIFKLLSGFGEYGEVSKVASKIIRNVEVFGQDITTAIESVASTIPSDSFKEILYGMLSTIRTGGNLKSYLQVQAKEALFTYRLKREEYLQALSTYADFYTAVMIAAPLFLISILAIMNVIGGTIQGMSIGDAMNLGIYLGIPAMNIAFIMFVSFTQPEQI